MKVVCAWCQREGKAKVLYEKESANDGVSHGICDEHVLAVMAEALMAEARKTRASASALDRLAS